MFFKSVAVNMGPEVVAGRVVEQWMARDGPEYRVERPMLGAWLLFLLRHSGTFVDFPA